MPSRFTALDRSMAGKWTAGIPNRVCDVIREAALAFELEPSLVVAKSQERQPVAARRYAAVRLRTLGFSTPQIGRWLGNRHHTTVRNLLIGFKMPETVPELLYDSNTPDESGIWAI